MGAHSWVVAAGAYTTCDLRYRAPGHGQRRDRPSHAPEHGRRPAGYRGPYRQVSPTKTEGRVERCMHALRSARTSAIGRPSGVCTQEVHPKMICTAWTRGFTRRRGVEARPRPGQTSWPLPRAQGDSEYSTKLHRYEVHTRQTTCDHDPRRTGQCNLHARVIDM